MNHCSRLAYILFVFSVATLSRPVLAQVPSDFDDRDLAGATLHTVPIGSEAVTVELGLRSSLGGWEGEIEVRVLEQPEWALVRSYDERLLISNG